MCVCVAISGSGGGDDLLPVLKTICERGSKTQLTYSSRERVQKTNVLKTTLILKRLKQNIFLFSINYLIKNKPFVLSLL